MKKLFVFAILSLSLLAETAVVDVNYIMEHHPKYTEAQNSISNEQKRLESIIKEKTTEIQNLKTSIDSKGEKATTEEIENFNNKNKEFQSFYSELENGFENFNNEKINFLYNDILQAMKIYTENRKDLVVVEKEAVYVNLENAKDITDDILKIISK